MFLFNLFEICRLLFKKTSRRHFIRVMAGTAGSDATIGVFASFGSNQGKDLKLALISDTHIPEDRTNNYRGFFPYKNLEMIVPQIAATELSGTIISGDLARLTGEPGERQDVQDKYILVLEHPSVRLVLLDSLIYTNLSPALGLLGKAQRDWLSEFPGTHGGNRMIRSKVSKGQKGPKVEDVEESDCVQSQGSVSNYQ